MKMHQAIQNLKTSLAVATGVVAIFGTVFTVTTLAASAAEEAQQEVAVDAPSDIPASPEPTEAPRPEPRRRPGPAFSDLDADGDGTISREEFDAFQPMRPPRAMDDFPRDGYRWNDRGPGPDAREPRAERFDDRRFGPRGGDREFRPQRRTERFDDRQFGPPPRGGRQDARGQFGPPQAPRGGQFDRQGGGCDHGGDARGQFDPRAPRGNFGGQNRPPRPPAY